MSYSLSPLLKPRFFTNNTNAPLFGGKLFTYYSGTTTLAVSYSDGEGTENANPIILDVNGECNLYLDDDIAYRLILKDANNVVYFDRDNLYSIGSSAGAAANSASNANTYKNQARDYALSAELSATSANTYKNQTQAQAAISTENAEQTKLDVISTNANAAATAADRIQTSADAIATASARDAALIQAGVYATEALGRAAVANGVYFKVAGVGNIAAYEYVRVDASTSTLVSIYPSKAYVDLKTDGLVGKNLFNIAADDISVGYFPSNTTGVLQANASYNTTGFIPVVAGQQYTVSNKHYWAWYDSSYTFISGTSSADTNATQTAPALAAYMRASANAATNWTFFQVELGAAATAFQAYGVFLKIAAVADRSITREKIALSAIDIAQTTFIKNCKNLFNKNTVTVGSYLGNTNIPVVNATYDYSDFIKVTPSTTYTSSHAMRFTTFFDANYAYIAGGSSTSTSTIAVPANVYYVRVSITHANLAVFQLEAGASATAYEAYSYKILGDNNEPLLVPASAISDGSLSRAKVDFLPIGKNKFNKATVTVGSFLGPSGTPTVSATYDYSDFIAVTVGATYVSNSAMRFTCYYDSAFAVVAGGSSASISTFTVPSGVAYVRVTITATTLDSFQLEIGSTSTGYQAYGYYLDAQDSVPIYVSTSTSVSGWNNATWATLGDSITAQALWQPYVVAKYGLLLTNYGVGGTKISGAGGDANAMCQDTRIDAIATTNDLITVMGGTNDWAGSVAMGTLASTDPLTFYGALNTMFSKLFTRFPAKRIMVFTTPYGEMPARISDGSAWPNAITNTQGLNAGDYAEAVRIAAKKWGVPCVDIFTDVGWNTVNLTTFMTADGNYIHPNTAGAKRIAEVVIGALARLEKIT